MDLLYTRANTECARGNTESTRGNTESTRANTESTRANKESTRAYKRVQGDYSIFTIENECNFTHYKCALGINMYRTGEMILLSLEPSQIQGLNITSIHNKGKPNHREVCTVCDQC